MLSGNLLPLSKGCDTRDAKRRGIQAKRDYHEKSGRLVRIDKFRTERDNKEKARDRTAEWKKRNPRERRER